MSQLLITSDELTRVGKELLGQLKMVASKFFILKRKMVAIKCFILERKMVVPKCFDFGKKDYCIKIF